MKHRSPILIFAAILLSIGATDALAGAKMTNEYKKGNLPIASIALLPPQAEMVAINVGADNSMVAESKHYESLGRDEAIANLEEKGYRVVAPTIEEIQDDPQLNELYRNAIASYDAETTKVRRSPGKVKKRRYNMGQEFEVLADYLRVDAIGVVRMQVQGASGGQMAVAILIGGSSGLAHFDLTVVNGENGDVEGYFYYAVGGVTQKKLQEDPGKFAVVTADKAMKKMPQAAAVGRVAAATESEEATMEELEDLLGEETEPADSGGQVEPESN